MDDVADLAVSVEDRRVEGTPEALLEAAALGLGPADVVLLNRHGVGGAGGAHGVERGAQVAHSVGGRVVGVVGEDVKQPAPAALLPPSHRAAPITFSYP